MKNYHINIFYSEEDVGYIADIPDLKYCNAFGEKRPLPPALLFWLSFIRLSTYVFYVKLCYIYICVALWQL